MIKLRLKRFGKKNQSSFRVVVVNGTSRRDGEPLEELGFYNPRTKESRLDVERLKSRLKSGAQPSETVKGLLKKSGVL
jgi:small subunit ribosomal protein S16